MLEYVYRLDLPKIADVVKQPFEKHPLEKLYVDNPHSKILKVDTEGIFKEEFLTIKGLLFHYALVFMKPPGYVGPIHTDDVNDNKIRWGINWVYGGSGGMRYWRMADLLAERTDLNPNNIPYSVFETNLPPVKEYAMVPDGVYLVHGTEAHLAYTDAGVDSNRYCISSRAVKHEANDKFNLNTWEDVVNMFSDLIVKD